MQSLKLRSPLELLLLGTFPFPPPSFCFLIKIFRIREDNSKREGERKGGLLINSGPNPNKELRKKWQEESKAKYGLTKEQIRTFKDQLEDLKKVKQSVKMEQVLSYSLQLDSMGKPELVELLKKLRGNLKSKFVFPVCFVALSPSHL